MANLDPKFVPFDAPNNGSRGSTSYWEEQKKLKERVAALEKKAGIPTPP